MLKKIQTLLLVMFTAGLMTCGGSGGGGEDSSTTLTYGGGELPAATVAILYQGTVATASGPSNITYSHKDQSEFPASLTLHPNGRITGLPALEDEDDYKFTVIARSGDQYEEATWTLEIVRAQLVYTDTVLPNGTIDEEGNPKFYEVDLGTATGATGILYALAEGEGYEDNKLPDGLDLSPDGKLSGYPEKALLEYTFWVTASQDTIHAVPATAMFTITVIDNRPPPPPYNITNNFAQDSSTAFMVQWHNSISVFTQTLQIVEESGSFDDANVRNIPVTGVRWNPTRTPATANVGNYDPRNIFTTTVAGLSPATSYQYRMGAPGAWSNTFYHLTSGGSNTDFSFTVTADTQSTDFVGMRGTFRAANTFDPANRFFLIAGDIVNYPHDTPQEFPNYTIAANEFNIRRPIATTQGNHDTYINSDPGNRDHYMFGSAEVFNAFMTFPDNGWARKEGTPHAGPHRSDSYYFYYNNVLIVMLNTMATQNATGPAVPNNAAQAAWLRQLLEHDRDNNLSKYRIIVTHIPIFGGREDARWADLEVGVRTAYAQLATDFDVDIFFSGHDHVYVRSNPVKFNAPNPPQNMSNFPLNPNGTIFSIPGGTGTRLDRFRNPITWAIQFYQVRHALCDGGCGVSHSAGHLPALPGNLCIAPGVFVNIQVTDEKMIVRAMRSSNPPVELDRYEITPKR